MKMEVIMNKMLLLVVLLAAGLFSGCAHVISNEARLAVDPMVDLALVRQNPTAYLGKTLLLGGLVVENRLTREGTDLEVLLFSLDRWGRPLQVDDLGGRFIARTERFLDPEIFKAGLHVTLTCDVAGKEILPLKGVDYHYPVFTINEIHVLRSPSQPYAYPPYYAPPPPWGPYYDPFWPAYNPYWDTRPVWRHR
jgi:outer membrane lipoprotein